METPLAHDVCCIISAVGNDYGVFRFDERLAQLQRSIQSVRKKLPQSHVVLFDASEHKLCDAHVNSLSSQVDHVQFLHDDPYVQFLKHHSKDPSENKFEKKTVGELRCMNMFLQWLNTHGHAYDRVFKLSGRYELSDAFDRARHDTHACVLKPKEDWFGEHVFTLRLWSFHAQLAKPMLHMWDRMQMHTYHTVTQTQKLEIVELVFTKFMHAHHMPMITQSPMGVCGHMGLAGEWINE